MLFVCCTLCQLGIIQSFHATALQICVSRSLSHVQLRAPCLLEKVLTGVYVYVVQGTNALTFAPSSGCDMCDVVVVHHQPVSCAVSCAGSNK